MKKVDLRNEEAAIERYKRHIKLADEEGDPGARHLLETILLDEEGHWDARETILGRKGK